MARAQAPEPQMTIPETCDYLHIRRSVLHEIVRAGRLTLVQVPGKGRGGAKRVTGLRTFLTLARTA